MIILKYLSFPFYLNTALKVFNKLKVKINFMCNMSFSNSLSIHCGLTVSVTIFVIDSPMTPNSHHDLGMSNGLQIESGTEYLQMARKGGGHTGNYCDSRAS